MARTFLSGYLLFIVLSICNLASWASDKSRIEALHQQAYDLLDSDLDAALGMADSSLIIAQKANLKWEEANSYYIKGYAFKHKNDLSKAVVLYLKAARILAELDDEESAMTYTSVLLNVGDIFRKYYKYQEAIELLNKGIEISSKWGFEKQELKLLYNKASALYFQGEFDKSLIELNEAISLARNQQDDGRLIKCWNLSGLIYKEVGAYSTAKAYFKNILQSSSSSSKDSSLAFHNTGLVYQKEANIDSAKRNFEIAYNISQKSGDVNAQFISLHALTEWAIENRQMRVAEYYAKEAEKLYYSLEKLPEQFSLFHMLHLIANRMGKFETASNYSVLYFDESQRFYSQVKIAMQAKDQFQMELVLAGFAAELEVQTQQKRAEMYRWLTIAGVILIAFLIVSWKIWFRWWRRNLWFKVHQVFTHKNPDGSYKMFGTDVQKKG